MARLDLGCDLVVLAESSTVWVTSEAEQERDKDTKRVGCKICVSPSLPNAVLNIDAPQIRCKLYRRFVTEQRVFKVIA